MIQTQRLIIRPFQEGDRNALVKLLMDAEFMAFSNLGAFDSEGAHQRFNQIISFTSKGFGKQAIILAESSELVGYCGIEPFELNGSQEMELGYRIVSHQRGQGIATEAALAVLAHSSIHRLFAYVEELNSKSIRVLLRLGFKKQGECIVNGKSYQLFEYDCDSINTQSPTELTPLASSNQNLH
ncbi:GNAT family N-acetyltransferase [Aquirhabdus parva]|uniref:N-acetyltransferase n=1 Tax=Aquirhabdus parva TaxID=2283318 RepID=A0A345P332_9GAMM|nr:GNAT family N-acetyltransferase [Aquirhabdus parva]AXI01691.1 N-acetyltransferase [Aquirhabdus parva]